MSDLDKYKEEVRQLIEKGVSLEEACSRVAYEIVENAPCKKGLSSYNKWVETLKGEIEDERKHKV